MRQELILVNEMVNRVFLELWRRKTRGHTLDEEYFKNFPIKRFDIVRLYDSILRTKHLSENSINRVSAILADLKLLFYFLGNVTDYFYIGIAKIVGNAEYEEVGLNTLSILQGNHYRVFLISAIYERLLDLLELVNFDQITDAKTNKWGKKFEQLNKIDDFRIISPAEHEKMIVFRDRVRRAEIHGLSSVFRQLQKENWDHFQEEEDLLRDIFIRISDELK